MSRWCAAVLRKILHQFNVESGANVYVSNLLARQLHDLTNIILLVSINKLQCNRLARLYATYHIHEGMSALRFCCDNWTTINDQASTDNPNQAPLASTRILQRGIGHSGVVFVDELNTVEEYFGQTGYTHFKKIKIKLRKRTNKFNLI